MAVVTGMFRNVEDAERAFDSAIRRGYADADITVLMAAETKERLFPSGAQNSFERKATEEVENKSLSARLGGPAGGTLGILAPVLAAGVVLMIPGFGIVAAGPLAIALTAAGTVGLAGGLVGALTNWGIPADRTEEYEASIRDGGILMGVTTSNDEETAHFKKEWSEFGAELVHA